MSDLLARFQAQTKRKADPELIRRWEWDARYHGDKNIKTQATNAERSATSMQKSPEQFNNLKPEHELAINAAANALRSMAKELTLLAAWVKLPRLLRSPMENGPGRQARSTGAGALGRQSACPQVRKRSAHRAGHHRQSAGLCGLVSCRRKYQDCKIEEIRCKVDRLFPGPTERIRAALTVQQGNDRTPANKWNGLRGPTVVCGWADYEAYLTYRKEVAETSAHIVRMASAKNTSWKEK